MMSKFKSYKVREKPLQPLHQLQRSHYQLHSFLTIKYIMSNKLAIYPKIFTKVVIFNIPKVVTPYTLRLWSSKKDSKLECNCFLLACATNYPWELKQILFSVSQPFHLLIRDSNSHTTYLIILL